jgi:hypothetical protein
MLDNVSSYYDLTDNHVWHGAVNRKNWHTESDAQNMTGISNHHVHISQILLVMKVEK